MRALLLLRLRSVSFARAAHAQQCARPRATAAMATVVAEPAAAPSLDGNPLLMPTARGSPRRRWPRVAPPEALSLPPPRDVQAQLFPAFDKVESVHVVPAVRALLAELERGLGELEASASPSYSALAPPLERLTDGLGRAWGVAVADSEPLRAAYDEVQPEKVALLMRLAQSKPLFDAFAALRADGAAWAALSPAQRRVVDGELRDARLAGVALEGVPKERFVAITQELSALATKFSNNVLDATKAFARVETEAAAVAGLPPSALAAAAAAAASRGHAGATPEAGPWAFTLDGPSYTAVLSHAAHRPLREAVYRAYMTRASTPGTEGDNGPLIERTLALKRERAALLGYPHAAAVSLASKMATLEGARGLLEELRGAAFAAAGKDLEEANAFAAARGAPEAAGGGRLRQWDVPYWAERLREERYAYTEEELRPYFSLDAVLSGLFALIGRLFGVSVAPADGEAAVWHPDVRFFRLSPSAGGAPFAYVYLDPYARPATKRGGAWMDDVCGRSAALAAQPPQPGAAAAASPAAAAAGPRLAVAHMVCNGTPPVGGAPSLMTFREVETLFHEMGHALQHMLTKVDEGLVSGIRGVEWDAVELPSQFMENWCYHKPTLLGMAKHWQTGEPLPDALFDKIVAAKTFRAGSALLRQLHFATTDLELHSDYVPGGAGAGTAFDVERRLAAKTAVMPPLPEDRFLCGFSHIFAGGYSAGYYSYKWAEVLSADAFGAFEEAGLDDAAAVASTGRRFADTVLALGGSVPPADVFHAFRGRDPSTAALLRHSGLTAAA